MIKISNEEFTPILHRVTKSQRWSELSPYAQAVYVQAVEALWLKDSRGKFINNQTYSKIKFSYRYYRGTMSKSSFYNAINELIEAGLIKRVTDRCNLTEIRKAKKSGGDIPKVNPSKSSCYKIIDYTHLA